MEQPRTRRREKQNLRIWLKMLSSTGKVEKHVRSRLREDFETTLPRFDVLAELYRRPNGVTMGELSSMLMVSNGNLTGLANRLQQDGLILKAPMPTDKRTHLLYITREGKSRFEEMAKEHEAWVGEFFKNFKDEELAQLLTLLSKIEYAADKDGTEETDDEL